MSYLFLVLYYLLAIYDLFFWVRAICSWVPSFRESKVYYISYKLTEPILRPVRDLLFRMEFARRCPIDLSFLAVVLILSGLMRICAMLA
ncbi:MAG: YggT family protein [Clostridia bacterium]|nr:YggT family protein [Clostridia bacterium]